MESPSPHNLPSDSLTLDRCAKSLFFVFLSPQHKFMFFMIGRGALGERVWDWGDEGVVVVGMWGVEGGGYSESIRWRLYSKSVRWHFVWGGLRLERVRWAEVG